MKKGKALLGLLAAFVSVGCLASCDDEEPVTDNPTNDSDQNKDETPAKVTYEVSFDSKGGSDVAKITVDENGTATKPADPTKKGFNFKGWYADDKYQTPFDFTTKITKNTTVYARWFEAGGYSINFNDHCTGYTLDDDYSIKNVKIMDGCSLSGDQSILIDDVEYKRIKTEGSASATANIPTNRAIQVEVFGAGKVKMWVKPSGNSERTFKVSNNKKKVIFTKDCADLELFEVELEFEEATTIYAFGTNGFDIYRIDTEWEVENKGNVTSIEITSTGSNNFIQGEDFSASGLDVMAIYDTGYKELIYAGTEEVNYQIDSSEFNKNTSGYYPITVSYKNFTAEYNAYVYAIEEFKVDQYYMSKDTENIWGNGSLRNVYSRQINLGDKDSYDTSALTVSVFGKVINEKKKEKTKLFILNEQQFELTCANYNKATDGTYTVSVETPFGNGSYETYVVTTTPVINQNTVTARVTPSYTGKIGAVNSNNEHMFTTINSAIEYLTYGAGIEDSTKKVLYVDAGTYKEKVDVDVPNFTLIGAGKDSTIITFDASNGLPDPRGTLFGTDGSCTFGVRSTATNFTAKNITFDSYFNNLSRYNALKAKTSGTQALAIMIQADMSAFYNCGFTGFQDTIEMQGSGRQYFYKCLVSGATDYIFGTNSSALFDECEILTIDNGQTTKNGGYITAPKGLNKGGDWTAFGYVFNKCNFTQSGLWNATLNDGEGGYTLSTWSGTTSLGRAWDTGASITIMNSEMGGHISTLPFDNTPQGKRLASGLNANWYDATTSCKEYNNTGAGSINADQTYKVSDTFTKTTCKMITETEANAILTNFFKTYTVLCPSNNKYDFTAPEWTKPVFE